MLTGSFAHHIDRFSRNPAIYLGLGLGCILLAAYCIVSATPAFDQRTIGIAIQHAQDPSVRNVVHVLGVLAGVCLFLSLLLCLRSLPAERVSSFEPRAAGPVCGLLLVANLLLYFWYGNPFFLTAAGALCYMIALGLVIRFFENEQSNTSLLWVLAALTFQGIITAGSVSGIHLQFGLKYYCVFSVILAFLLWLTRTLQRNANVNSLTLSYALLPLMLTPLSIIAANEVQYALGSHFQYAVPALHVWVVFFCMILLAVAVRFVRFSTARRHDSDHMSDRTEWLLMSRYLPLILVSSVAFSEYMETVNFFSAHRDFFHGGEAIVPVQQIIQFGSIPYIDFYPPHGFFDILPQLFYQVVNRGEYVESILWGQGYGSGWLPRMLAIAVMYWLLKIFLDYKSAFLILLFLPTYHVLHPYYVILFLPLIALNLEKSTIRGWLPFWFLLVLVFLWRIDFGLASMVASFFVFMGLYWQGRFSEKIGRSFLAGALVAAIAISIFSFLAVSSGKSPVEIAQQIIQYIQVQTPLSALEKIVKQIDHAAVLQYLALPAIGALVAAHFLSVVLRRERLTLQAVILAFLAIASLVISARSLNRHSHYEGVFNPYFFVLLAGLSPVVMCRFPKVVNTALFVFICVGTYIFLPKSTSPYDAIFYRPTLQQEYPYPTTMEAPVELVSGLPPETRLVHGTSGAETITSFLRSYLKEPETFYDFSNAPLLYALSEKKMPSFIMETFFHTSEDIQHHVIRDLEQLFQQDNLPIVLFGQLPASSVWNQLDNVHTPIRSYRIAEYLYHNFTPCAQVDGYDIWLARHRRRDGSCTDDLLAALSGNQGHLRAAIKPAKMPLQKFDMMKLPYVWANHDELMPSPNCTSAQNVSASILLAEGDKSYRLALPEDVSHENGNFLHLQLRSQGSSRASVAYAGGNRFDFDVISSADPQDYLIRVSSQYAWHQQQFDEMLLTFDGDLDVVCAALLPGD